MNDRIAELRAAVAHLRDAHVDDRRHMMIDFISLGEVGALLDCAEALRALLSYTKACEELLNVMPAGQIHIAEEALAKLNGERDAG